MSFAVNNDEKQLQAIDEVIVQAHAFSDGRISDAETLSADVVPTAVAIIQIVLHKIWR